MLGSVLWALAAVPAALANPIAVAEPEVHFEDPRACTPPANYVKNPGFETGTLANWDFHSTYAGTASGAVLSGGFTSPYAVVISGNEVPGGPGSVGTLSQIVPICSTAQQALSFTFLQGEGNTKYDLQHSARPSLSVGLFDPGGVYYTLASLYFKPTAYNATTFGPTGTQDYLNKPVGKWTTYTVPFPKAQAGNWTISVREFTNTGSGATSNSMLKVRFDNFVIKAK